MSAISQITVETEPPLGAPGALASRSGSHGALATLMAVFAGLASAVARTFRQIKVQRAHKALRLCESLSLGDKRFVAVVQVDGERFLLGGSSASVSLLTRLQPSPQFADALQQTGKEESPS